MKPSAASFITVFQIQYLQGIIENTTRSFFRIRRVFAQFGINHITRLLHIRHSLNMLTSHAPCVNGLQDLAFIELFSRDVANTFPFLNESDERALALISRDQNDVVHVVTIQTTECRNEDVILLTDLQCIEQKELGKLVFPRIFLDKFKKVILKGGQSGLSDGVCSDRRANFTGDITQIDDLCRRRKGVSRSFQCDSATPADPCRE